MFCCEFFAKNPIPKKFIYLGCTEKSPKEMCKGSLEGPMENHYKLHNSLVPRKYMEFFCFELALFDETFKKTTENLH